jgi:PAS domain S-box-containing protein
MSVSQPLTPPTPPTAAPPRVRAGPVITGRRGRNLIAVLGAVVAVALMGASWSVTTNLRDQAESASAKVVAVTKATAQLSRLQAAEDALFTGSASALSVNFTAVLARVLGAANAIHDPAAGGAIANYVVQSESVVNLIDQNKLAAAARAAQRGQGPAGDELIAEYNRYASAESARANSILGRAGRLSEIVDLSALALLALALGLFWFLDGRSDDERRRAVERTEARFRGIVARGSDAVWLVDERGAILFASESTKEVLGVDVDEAARPSFIDLFPDDEREFLREALVDVVFDPTRPVTVAASVTEPDKRYLEVVLTNKCADETIGAVVVSVRDLTERHRAETALERSEAMIQDLIDHTPVIVFVKDLEGRYLRVNKAWAMNMGQSAAKVIGKTSAELFSPANAEAMSSADRLALVRGPYEAELHVEFEGRRRTFLASHFALLDSSGQPYAFGGVAIDISERAREEDLERTLGAMVSTSGDAIFTTSNGEIVFWNDAATALLGYVSGDVLGATTSRLTPEGYRDHHQRMWDEVGGGPDRPGRGDQVPTKGRHVDRRRGHADPPARGRRRRHRRLGDRARRHRAARTSRRTVAPGSH